MPLCFPPDRHWDVRMSAMRSALDAKLSSGRKRLLSTLPVVRPYFGRNSLGQASELGVGSIFIVSNGERSSSRVRTLLQQYCRGHGKQRRLSKRHEAIRQNR